MFNAPEVISQIPDIKVIYEINDKQGAELDESVQQLDDNIFLDDMDETMIKRWEAILKIIPLDNDTLEDRRFCVKSKVLDKLPYSYRVIIRKMDTLCPNGYSFRIDDNRLYVDVSLSLKFKRMITDINELIDSMLPLNIVYNVSLIYNSYVVLSKFTHKELSKYSHIKLRDEVLGEGGSS